MEPLVARSTIWQCLSESPWCKAVISCSCVQNTRSWAQARPRCRWQLIAVFAFLQHVILQAEGISVLAQGDDQIYIHPSVALQQENASRSFAPPRSRSGQNGTKHNKFEADHAKSVVDQNSSRQRSVEADETNSEEMMPIPMATKRHLEERLCAAVLLGIVFTCSTVCFCFADHDELTGRKCVETGCQFHLPKSSSHSPDDDDDKEQIAAFEERHGNKGHGDSTSDSVRLPFACEDLRFASAIFGAWLVHWTFGTFNTWGNISPYITSYMQMRGHDVDYETTSKALSLAGISLGCSMYLGGRLQGIFGLRGSLLVGGWTVSLGVALSSITVEYGMVPFLFTYSVMFGVGMGLGYTAPIVCLMNWMPDRKGLASGLVVFAFGSGGLVFDPIQAALVNPLDMEPTRRMSDGVYFDWENPDIIRNVLERVPHMFQILAMIYAVMQLIGVILLMMPRKPQLTLRGMVRQTSNDQQFTVRDMVKTKQFWLLFGNFLCNTQAVFFTITYSKIVAASTVRAATSDAGLTTIVAVGSLTNGMGRLFWGTFNDKNGFQTSMMTLCTIQSCLVMMMPFCHAAYEYSLACWTIFFCDIFSLFPSVTALYFGTENVGANYGIVFLGFTFGMLIAPRVAEIVIERWSLDGLCWTTAGFIICGGILATQNSPPAKVA